MPKKYTTVAIAYDFDGTLAEGNIQENSFIPNLGIKKDDFWRQVKQLAKDHDMDEILAYMYLLIDKARSGSVKVDKNSIREHGKYVRYFVGVEDFFLRMNEYAKEHQINLKHYIISSGTKEMIEATSIAKHFEYIFASSFKYDQHGVAEWPALAINYTVKTQYLFRINKGIKNAWDNSRINKFTPEVDRPVPFENMIYIGDGETDIPAMKMINYQSGTSIAVYQPGKKGAKSKVENLLKEKRATYIAPADYSNDEAIDKIIKSVIRRISARELVKVYSKLRQK